MTTHAAHHTRHPETTNPAPPPRLEEQSSPPRLEARGITIGYGKRVISTDLHALVPEGSFTAIIGPNASGKSTLLRALARLLKPTAGTVQLAGRDLQDYAPKELARALGLLPQTATAPDGITVAGLVSRGRFPHQNALDRWSLRDEEAVTRALAATGVADLATRLVSELSGGQRQRVWVAMVLAQQSDVLLLDEPTTYLDIAHQVAVMDLFQDLNRRDRHTLVAVLHDLNQAARYASHVIAVADGAVAATGRPEDVVTEETVERVFGLPCRVIEDPETGTPLVVPRARPLPDDGADAATDTTAADPSAPTATPDGADTP
ncbi:iron complex transport system ATP-binding protein [Quadrisphaera granulorum]|uniref:Iron complex transport system ATP-binding protein n=1 Tax=Quadrisphaera granulorum TaxID=317664 RepID=A0A315ZQ61_9ACTN|nr:ABC transporter ATP-binding protein [Quadrisphaera granulorum]PWJ47711.1 iron complex transport system ATP-binding protein [Quadrisphaera granulorum]SZE98665.1 iron complex transport system ATP-binding protein [Quadrisphaera granulorum]